MSDLTGPSISWASLMPWQREVIASVAGLEPFSLERTIESDRRGTTAHIQEARLVAVGNAHGVSRKSRPGRVMRTVLRSTQKPTLSYTRPGRIARARRST